MQITKIVRQYSRSVNTKNFGAPTESWVRIEATYEANVESLDEPNAISAKLYEMCRQDVSAGIKTLGEQIANAQRGNTVAPAGSVTAPSSPRQL